MDELIAHIQEEVPWYMLFTDDIVLMDELRDVVNTKLERWSGTVESKSFKISHTKTEYMDCNFSGHIQKAETNVRIEAQKIPQRVILLPWLDH